MDSYRAVIGNVSSTHNSGNDVLKIEYDQKYSLEELRSYLMTAPLLDFVLSAMCISYNGLCTSQSKASEIKEVEEPSSMFSTLFNSPPVQPKKKKVSRKTTKQSSKKDKPSHKSDVAIVCEDNKGFLRLVGGFMNEMVRYRCFVSLTASHLDVIFLIAHRQSFSTRHPFLQESETIEVNGPLLQEEDVNAPLNDLLFSFIDHNHLTHEMIEHLVQRIGCTSKGTLFVPDKFLAPLTRLLLKQVAGGNYDMANLVWVQAIANLSELLESTTTKITPGEVLNQEYVTFLLMTFHLLDDETRRSL